jgi:hypothetical protein
MHDSTHRSVAPRFGVNGPRSGNGRAEASKSFRFSVTWHSVTSHLRLVEAAQLRNTATVESRQSSLAAAAAVAVVTPAQQTRVPTEVKARWEMVVPKMDRANRLRQAAHDYPPASIPAMPALPSAPPAPFLTRALAVVGMRGRASNLQVLQLNAPAPATPPEKTVNEGRELLLSKITKALRSRAQESALL